MFSNRLDHMHGSGLIGGDIAVSPPPARQARLNAIDIQPRPRIGDPVALAIVETLARKFPDFDRAYNEDGLTVEPFDCFAPTRRTLRQFMNAWRSHLGISGTRSRLENLNVLKWRRNSDMLPGRLT